jgi:hypothetical protein
VRGDRAAEEDLALVLAIDHRAEASDMPHCVTMRRAMSVARSKSLEAPVVIWFMKISSAMRPPNSTAMVLSRRSRSWL